MNENLTNVKTKPAKNGSARLISTLSQHVAKNILVEEDKWDGAAEGREGGTALASRTFILDRCKPEAITREQLPPNSRESQHTEGLSLWPLSYKALQKNFRSTKNINWKISR